MRIKVQTIALFLGIINYLLAIPVHLKNLGLLDVTYLLDWLYPFIDYTTMYYGLLILGTAFVITYIITRFRKYEPPMIAFVTRRRPSSTSYKVPAIGNLYGVKWRLYEPELFEKQPWADGPYCPNCDRELEVIKKGLRKKEYWNCSECEIDYKKPEGNMKDRVEKDFAAELRRRGRLH